jgi:hypothetical protein
VTYWRASDLRDNTSHVYQVDAAGSLAKHARMPAPPFTEETDWTNAVMSCGEARSPSR